LLTVLASDVVAEVYVPPCDNSAMDGYVFSSEATGDAGTWYELGGVIAAGAAPSILPDGKVMRIFTGAPVPKGADTVEMQENCSESEGKVRFEKPVKRGSNIRQLGQDIRKGEVVLEAGAILSPENVGLLASVGISRVEVFCSLSVGLLSTGDELAEPGESLAPGRIYNSNRPMLKAMLSGMQFRIVDAGCVDDDEQATRKQLEGLIQECDVVITTGGVSVGEEDHVKKVIGDLGHLHLWKVAVKPGKPLAFATVEKSAKGQQAVFFGLPGNPVSAYVTFLLFVKPFLLKKQGCDQYRNQFVQARAGFEWPATGKQPGKREEYLRAQVNNGTVSLFPNQSSGVLSSVSWANCLARIPAGQRVYADEWVDILPLP
jgi:molybdopterin molybdotransferase